MTPIQFPSLHKTLFSKLSSLLAFATSRATSVESNFSPQKRHFTASSLITSAQAGHFLVYISCDTSLLSSSSSVIDLPSGLAHTGTSPLDLHIGQVLGIPDLRQIE
jgi:hypothetical protein